MHTLLLSLGPKGAEDGPDQTYDMHSMRFKLFPFIFDSQILIHISSA